MLSIKKNTKNTRPRSIIKAIVSIISITKRMARRTKVSFKSKTGMTMKMMINRFLKV